MIRVSKTVAGFLFLVLAACADADASLYPLDPGLSWTYQGSVSTSLLERSMHFTITNMPARELDGRTVTPQRGTLGGETDLFGFYGISRDGVAEYAVQCPGDAAPQHREPPRFLLRFPVEPGIDWACASELKLLAEDVPVLLTMSVETIEETVTVPAGTFTSCVKVVGSGAAEVVRRVGVLTIKGLVTVEATSWYAPGVGSVRATWRENSNNPFLGSSTLSLQLISYDT